MTLPSQPLTKKEMELMREKHAYLSGLSLDGLHGVEERAAAAYFVSLPRLLSEVERQRGEIEELQRITKAALEDRGQAFDALNAEQEQTELLNSSLQRKDELIKEAEEMAKFYSDEGNYMYDEAGNRVCARFENNKLGVCARAFLSSLQRHRLDALTAQGQEERMEK